MGRAPDEVAALRARRAESLRRRQREQQRTAYGPALVSIVGQVLGISLRLEDFSSDVALPREFVWPQDIQRAPGLVSAYVDRPTALRLLSCVTRALGPLQGHVGFHDKAYLGFACVHQVRCASLLEIAEKSESAVLFCLSELDAVVLADFYRSVPGREFSVVVQGEGAVRLTRDCFVGTVND